MKVNLPYICARVDLTLVLLFMILTLGATSAQAYSTAAPSWVNAAPFGGNDVTLSWAAVSGADHYERQLSTNGGVSWDNSRSYTSTSVKLYNHPAGKTYLYQVRSCPSSGACSSWVKAAPFTVYFVAPSWVNAAPFGGNDVTLSWASVSGADHYERQLSTNGGVSWDNSRSYTSTSVKLYNHPAGKAYLYQVRACPSSGACSPWVKAAPFTVSLAAPSVSAVLFGGNDIRLSWSAVSGATSYEGALKTDGGSWGASRTYTNTSVNLYNHPEGLHVYRVRARSSAGIYSPWVESERITVNPDPILKTFYWNPSTTTTGQNSYFYWDVENVTSCTSTVSGTQPISGRLGPYTFSEPRDSTTKWYCTDLNGDRYPSSGYLEARHIVNHPSPSKVSFQWSPSTVEVGKPTTFEWQIDNVKNCTSTASGLQPSNDKIGPMILYGEGSVSTTKWFCTDLNNNRYPVSGYLEATRTVTNVSMKEHIAISFTNSNTDSIVNIADDFIAMAKPLTVDGELTAISTVSFRYFKTGTLDVLAQVEAVYNAGTTEFTSTFGSGLATGDYVLQVVVDGISQSGLTKYFTVVEPIEVKFGWFPAIVEVGKPTTFEWQIDNVESCTSTVSGSQPTKGSIGPVTFYGEATTSITQWYCNDSSGNRYPSVGYLEATRIVNNSAGLQPVVVNAGDQQQNTSSMQHIVVSVVPDANISFETVRFSLDSINWYRATKNADGSFDFKFHRLPAGNYTLEIEIDGVRQHGLSQSFEIIPGVGILWQTNLVPIDVAGITVMVPQGNSESANPGVPIGIKILFIKTELIGTSVVEEAEVIN